MKPRILIIDDDRQIRKVLEDALQDEYTVAVAESGEQAVDILVKDNYIVVITDMMLPGMSGIDVVRKIKEISPDTVTILLTGFGTIESAVETIKEGAFNYLTKPFKMDELFVSIKRAIEYSSLKRENSSLRKEVEEKYSFEKIIGRSDAILEIFEVIKKVADSDSTILLLGESGIGKELIAKTIHYNSSRRDQPFIPVNCGAIPGELLESELFGHEKGAFTGATATRPGRFERSHRGTIFLDEIGELAMPLQVKLLRVIQEREFERVGGNKTIQVDVRIIAATNKDLEEAVERKTFRKDLYYRLNVIPMVIPPLRERREDIPLLADEFLKRLAARKKREIKGISKDAMDVFVKYPWHGNVRELENIIERIVILKHGNGQITPQDIPAKIRDYKDNHEDTAMLVDIPQTGINLAKTVEDLERCFIEKALTKTGGVKSKAAELLGINRTTLIEKMKKKGMLPPNVEVAK